MTLIGFEGLNIPLVWSGLTSLEKSDADLEYQPADLEDGKCAEPSCFHSFSIFGDNIEQPLFLLQN